MEKVKLQTFQWNWMVAWVVKEKRPKNYESNLNTSFSRPFVEPFSVIDFLWAPCLSGYISLKEIHVLKDIKFFNYSGYFEQLQKYSAGSSFLF